MARPDRSPRPRAPLLELALGLVAALAVAGWASTSSGRAFEERAQGLVLAARGPVPWNPEVLVLVVDEETIRRVGLPIPRGAQARVMGALAKAGARGLTYDSIFLGPSSDEGGDAALAEAMRAFGRVVLLAECHFRDWNDPRALAASLEQRGWPRGRTPGEPCVSGALPHGPLAEAGILAHGQIAYSDSGLKRAVHLFSDLPGARLPSLALATYLAGQSVEPRALDQLPSGLWLGERFIAADERGAALVTYRGLPPHGTLNYADLLDAVAGGDAELPPELAERVRGRHLFFGLTSRNLHDYNTLATGAQHPLVALHAAQLSDLLEGRSVREPSRAARTSIILLAGLLLTWATLGLRPRLAALALLAGVLSLAALSSKLAGWDVWISPLWPALAATLSFAAASSGRLARRERERRILTDAFGAYVDRAVLRRILDDPKGTLSLGGARKTLSVLFADIKGYTGLSNERPPEEVLRLLREYLEVMTHVITSRGGRVDKIMGDGIMAVFGDPLPDPDHPLRATEAGAAMQAEMVRLCAGWARRGLQQVSIRVGIATGEVFVGNIGSTRSKIEYTALGPAVNLASRLEGQALPGGVLICEATARGCQGRFELQEVAGLVLKGFSSPQRAYRLLGPLSAGA